MTGQTVFYRLSKEDAFNVNKRRFDAHRSAFLEDDQGDTPGAVMHFGEQVREGQMLPAEVVKAYSEFEQRRFEGDSNSLETSKKRYFSGVADLRVKLPGNDVLWVPRARLDENPRLAPEDERYGVGTLVLPEPGRFTVVAPPPLV